MTKYVAQEERTTDASPSQWHFHPSCVLRWPHIAIAAHYFSICLAGIALVTILSHLSQHFFFQTAHYQEHNADLRLAELNLQGLEYSKEVRTLECTVEFSVWRLNGVPSRNSTGSVVLPFRSVRETHAQ